VLVVIGTREPFTPNSWFVAICISVISLSFASDFLFVAITRQLLRSVQRFTSYLTILILLVGNSACAAFLVVVPFYWGAELNDYRTDPAEDIGFVLKIASLFNCVDAFLAALFALLVLLLLMHRALWPLLTRTLFRMADIATKAVERS
jgi:hypothetical protein